MKILLDHCLPRRLNSAFPNHDVSTAVELGWDALRNGKLLVAAAANQFDLLLTIDKNLKHQQNLANLPIAVVVILPPTNRFKDLIGYVPAIEEAIKTLTPRTLLEVTLSKP